MRDMALLLLIASVVLIALRYPWIGIMGWTVTSLMSPHIEFGYAARTWPVAMAVAVTTLVGFAISKDRQNPFYGAGPKWLLALVIWITLTLPFSIYLNSSTPLWDRSIKIFLMVFVTLAVLTDRRKLDVFIWCVALSIGFYGIKGGVFTIASGGSYRVWGPGGFIEGNNELGLAVVCVIPLFRYLQLQMANRWARYAMTGAMALSAVMALGTHSRGALVGMAAMLLMFWWRNKNKALWACVLVAGGGVALSMMPAHWWDRMNTIQTYQQDDSALGRLNAWDLAIRVANDRLTGGGFFMWTGEVFRMYSPNPERHHAAHSIYFQVLGEQGWIGLFLFLAIGVATWLACAKLRRLGKADPELRWANDLGSMVQVSMVGFATAGAFLSLTWFDLPYNQMIMATIGLRLAVAQVAARKVETARTAIPPHPSGPRAPRGVARPSGASP